MRSLMKASAVVLGVVLVSCSLERENPTAPKSRSPVNASADKSAVEQDVGAKGSERVIESVEGAIVFMADVNTRELIEESARLTAGGQVTGRFHIQDNLHRIKGTVTCFTIVGNTVRIAGRAEESTAPLVPPGMYLAWTEVDNDGKHPRVPDTTTQVVLADQDLASLHCRTGLNLAPEFPAIAGKVEIHPEPKP